MVDLLLDVHGQHLAAEGKAFRFLNHLLVWRYGIVSHDDVTLGGNSMADVAFRREHRFIDGGIVPTAASSYNTDRSYLDDIPDSQSISRIILR